MNPAAHSPIALRDLRPALLVAALALLALFLIEFDQGTVSRTGVLLHELMHDGRHVLGAPCH